MKLADRHGADCHRNGTDSSERHRQPSLHLLACIDVDRRIERSATVRACGDADPGRAAGRPDQIAIYEGFAVGSDGDPLVRIDLDYRVPREHRHLALLPEGGRTDEQAFERFFARQIEPGI